MFSRELQNCTIERQCYIIDKLFNLTNNMVVRNDYIQIKHIKDVHTYYAKSIKIVIKMLYRHNFCNTIS